MDTSTPVRNDFLAACVSDNLPPIDKDDAEEFSRDSSEFSSSIADISCVRSKGEESPCPNLNKSAELFPCSPIGQKNIPHALLPLLDTPNHQWSDSILTPYKCDSENEPSSTIRTQNFPRVKNFRSKSPACTVSSFAKYYDAEFMAESSVKLQKDSGVFSPVLHANQKSNRRSSNRCIKELFRTNEGDSAVTKTDEISYQSLSETTLNALEHVCQTSETLYSNSSMAKQRSEITNHDSNDNDTNILEKSPEDFERYLTECFDDNLRYRRRFVYPYDAIKRPVSPIRIDQVIESVLPLERCERVIMKKSQVIPRGMVSFNELSNDEGMRESASDSYSSITAPFKIDVGAVHVVMRRHRNVYRSLKSLFSICRTNFVRSKDDIDSCLPISSQLTLWCEKREFISRLHDELRVLRTGVRIRVLEQFVNFFRCHINLAYNDFGPRKNYVAVTVPNFRRRKRSSSDKLLTVTRSKRNNRCPRNIEVSTRTSESISIVQALLADMQASDFEVDVELDPSQKLESKRSMLLGFSTARGKKIDVCSDQIVRAQKMLENISKTLTAETSETNFSEENPTPPSKLATADEAESIRSEAVGGTSVDMDENLLFSQDDSIFDSIPADLTQSIVLAPSTEPHTFKRVLQITSPEIKQSKPKRMKREIRKLSEGIDCDVRAETSKLIAKEINYEHDHSPPDFTTIEEFEDIPEISGNFSTSVLDEFSKDCSLLECVARPVSPELCSSVGRLKPPPNANRTSDTAVSRASKISLSASEIDENFQRGTDDELFSEVSESLFLGQTDSGMTTTVGQTAMMNDLLSNDTPRMTVGFKTASGNRVKVSQADLKKARKIFEEVDKAAQTETFQCPPSPELKIVSSSGTRLPKFLPEKSESEIGSTPTIPIAKNELDPSKIELQENLEWFRNLDDLSTGGTFIHPVDTNTRLKLPELTVLGNQNTSATSKTLVPFRTAAGHGLSVRNLKRAQNFIKSVEADMIKENFLRPVSPEIGSCPKKLSTRDQSFQKNEERVKMDPILFRCDSGNEVNVLEKTPKSVDEEVRQQSTSPEIGATSKTRFKLRLALENVGKETPFPEVEKTLQRITSPKSGLKQKANPTVVLEERKDAEIEFVGDIENFERSSKISVSFSTAAGNQLSAPKAYLEKARKIFEDLDGDLLEASLRRPIQPRKSDLISQPSSITAELRPTENSRVTNLSVPPESVSTGNELSASIKLQETNADRIPVLRQRSVSPEIGLRATSFSSTRPKLRDMSFQANDESSYPEFPKMSISFSTAAGARLSAPKAYLEKARKIFEDVDKDLLEKNFQHPVMTETSGPISQPFLFGKELVSNEQSKALDSDGHESKLPINLEERRSISPEMGPNLTRSSSPRISFLKDDKDSRTVAPKISVSFCTAAGNKLNTPKTYLDQARKIFKDVDQDFIEESFPSHKLSSIAEEKAASSNTSVPDVSVVVDNELNIPVNTRRKLHNSVDKRNEDGIWDCGRHSVSPEIGSSSSSSRSARSKLRKITVQDDDYHDESSRVQASKMSLSFSTAVGNEITVSKKALEKVQKLFQSLDSENENEVFGLTSDSNDPGLEYRSDEQVLNKIHGIDTNAERVDVLPGCVGRGPEHHDAKDVPNITKVSGIRHRDSKFVSSSADGLVPISAGPRSSSESNSLSPPKLPRAVSPVVETRRSYQLKKRQKRRSQPLSNSAPLSLIYNGKENESTSSPRASPEDLLRKIKETFSQRSNKRKEVGNVSPVSKRSKESETATPVLKASRRHIDVQNKSKVDCAPRCGSILLKQKNTKRMTLRQAVNGARPGCYKAQELIQLGLKPSVISVDAQNAGQFVFSSEFLGGENLNNLYGDECLIMPNENNEVRFENLVRGFLSSPGVDPKLVSEDWIRNHYRWIVWKLSAFEKSYPHLFGNNYLTLNNVLCQLKYRYDREIDRCERSALKRILERDDSSSRPMILCVASVKQLTGALNEFELELTDGWYSVWCQLDLEMYKLIMRKRVVVGTKLLISNAELIGASEGRDPLETDETVRLKIATNSTRLARWDALLGFYMSSSLPVVRDLRIVSPNGGITYPVLSVVARIYPMLYLEKKDKGYSELYGEKIEFRKAANYQKERQDCWEQLVSVISRELEQENKGDDCFDPEKLNSLVQERLESRLPERFRRQRVVLRLLKMRIVNDCNHEDRKTLTSALVTIWNPSEDVVSLLKEGKLYRIHNLSANDARNRELMLTSNRSTQYELQSVMPKSTSHQRRYTMISELKRSYVGLFNEIDTVGIVIDSEIKSNNEQIIYLADLERNILAVKFRLHLKDYGFEEVLKKKSIVAAINLHWRSEMLPSSDIPFTIVTEYTIFTQRSRLLHLQSQLDEFDYHFKLKNLDTFVEECGKKLQHHVQSHFPRATSTPVKPIPLKNAEVKWDNVSNESESSVNVSCNTEKSLKSKDTQSRIDRLRQYGEPPPLSPITMTSASNVRPRARATRLLIKTGSFRANDGKSNRSS